MKKILYGSLILFALQACKKENSTVIPNSQNDTANTERTYVELSGFFKTEGSPESNTFLIVDPLAIKNRVLKRFFIDPKGHFSDTIQNVKEGFYVLLYEGNATRIYLKNGDLINLRTNGLSTRSFLDSLTIKGSTESAFLAELNRFNLKLSEGLPPDRLFKLNEKTFVTKIDSIKQLSLNFVQQAKNLSPEIKQHISQDLTYDWGLKVYEYPQLHAELTQNQRYNSPKDFYVQADSLSYKDVALFKTNLNYRDFSVQRIDRSIIKQFNPSRNKDLVNFYYAQLKKDSIPSYIQDFMMVQFAQQSLMQSLPSFDQYVGNVMQQFQAYQKKNPGQKFMAPKKDDLRKSYDQEMATYQKSLDGNYQKIAARIVDPELKTYLNNKYQEQKGLAKGDKAPPITVLDKDGIKRNLLDIYAGENLLVMLWTASSDQTMVEFDAFNTLIDTVQDKRIKFVSVNIDLANKIDKWQLLCNEHALKGEAYMASDTWDSDFIPSYGVRSRSLPRFILINKKGEISSFEAPYPSDKKLLKLIESILLVDKPLQSNEKMLK